MKIVTDILPRMNFGDILNPTLSGLSMHLSNTIIYNQRLAKRMTLPSVSATFWIVLTAYQTRAC